jgi:hypothetical protein
MLLIALSLISIITFWQFFTNGLGLAYNDARSHLDIARRVVDGLKPGIAQLGSVWLPLPHILMLPTVWNDFMWHSGLSGGVISMISFVITGLVIDRFLQFLKVGYLGRLTGVFIFASNLNILYLQSTAMTELLLIATMTLSAFELAKWSESDRVLELIRASFWIMLSTAIRYDGWFLCAMALLLIAVRSFKRHGIKTVEGTVIFYSTLAGFGIFLWLLWNLLIFKDPFFFAFGPYSAHAQQNQLEAAGNLLTKHNWGLSFKHYMYAMIFNSGAFTTLMGVIGMIVLFLDKKTPRPVRFMSTVLIAPLLFNVLALYLGHSVLFIQGLSGTSWFNVRYGVMMVPSFAISIGFLVHRLISLRATLIGLLLFVTVFQFTSGDAVTIDDARVGSSQKNVTEVSGWLKENALNKPGYVLISAASHDAIIFSSSLPMTKFIHEGTGGYWDVATRNPSLWARWIVMRTHDMNDSTFKAIQETNELEYYTLVSSFPFADIYELKEQYLSGLTTWPALGKQK